MTDTTRIVVRTTNRFLVERVDATNKIVAQVKQGRSGPAGVATTTTINIATPSTTWTLAHYLGRYPSVTLIDTSGDIMLATLSYIDSNVITVTFSTPTNGTAYLN